MSGPNGGIVEPPDKSGLILNKQEQALPASLSTTTAWAVGGGAGDIRMRSFAEIIAAEKDNRNILEINLTRLQSNVKSLNYDDLGELIFDVLNVDYSLCLGFNYTTGRYGTREVKFKPGVDISPYIKPSFEYKGHEVSTKKQMNNLTKVTFRNVPFSVPDEEIIELCKCYGNPVKNQVNYDKMFNVRNKGMPGSTRWVEMELKPGVYMNNFYWMEGPLPGDTGSMITVLHSGQEQQCSHCLKTARGGCKALGNGKACEQLKSPRAKMADYMADLKRTIGYVSLKSQYLKQFPSLGSDSVSTMEEAEQGDDDGDEDLLPTNPIERRDAKIAELEKNNAVLPELQEKLLKMKAELHLAVKTSNVAKNKLKLARKALWGIIGYYGN